MKKKVKKPKSKKKAMRGPKGLGKGRGSLTQGEY